MIKIPRVISFTKQKSQIKCQLTDINSVFKSTDDDQEYKDVMLQLQNSPYKWFKMDKSRKICSTDVEKAPGIFPLY